jgi:uncharacterized protein (TIGR03382 family)
MKKLLFAALVATALLGVAQTTALAGQDRLPRVPRNVPEPTTALAAVAVAGFAWALRRRKD